jgi:hypothetical protein
MKLGDHFPYALLQLNQAQASQGLKTPEPKGWVPLRLYLFTLCIALCTSSQRQSLQLLPITLQSTSELMPHLLQVTVHTLQQGRQSGQPATSTGDCQDSHTHPHCTHTKAAALVPRATGCPRVMCHSTDNKRTQLLPTLLRCQRPTLRDGTECLVLDQGRFRQTEHTISRNGRQCRLDVRSLVPNCRQVDCGHDRCSLPSSTPQHWTSIPVGHAAMRPHSPPRHHAIHQTSSASRCWIMAPCCTYTLHTSDLQDRGHEQAEQKYSHSPQIPTLNKACTA